MICFFLLIFIIMELIITEGQVNTLQEKILLTIESLGLLGTIKFVGGYDTFLKIMKGVEWRLPEYMIPLINKVVSEFENFTPLMDIFLDPIIIQDIDDKVCQIEALYWNGAQVYCYTEDYELEDEFGYEIDYENLDSFDLSTIVDGLMEYYEEN